MASPSKKQKELEAIRCLCDTRIRKPLDIDYASLLTNVKNTLSLPPLGLTPDEAGVVVLLRNDLKEHSNYLKAVEKDCKPKKLACWEGFKGVATDCRCRTIIGKIYTVINFILAIEKHTDYTEIADQVLQSQLNLDMVE